MSAIDIRELEAVFTASRANGPTKIIAESLRDFLRDLTTEVNSLAESEAGDHDVPVGGTTGQVLAKTSDDDYDVEWITVAGGWPPDASGNLLAGNSDFDPTASTNAIVVGINAGQGSAVNLTQTVVIGYKAAELAAGDIFGGVVIGKFAAKNSLGGSGIAIGSQAGMGAEIDNNTFIGAQAGIDSTNNYNLFVGDEVGRNNSGYNNLGLGTIGSGSGVLIQNSGDSNIGIGDGALYQNSGNGNIAIGSYYEDNGPLDQNEGDYNIGIGQKAGNGGITGSNNIFIGKDATLTDPSLSNTAVIGNADITDVFFGSQDAAANVHGNEFFSGSRYTAGDREGQHSIYGSTSLATYSDSIESEFDTQSYSALTHTFLTGLAGDVQALTLAEDGLATFVNSVRVGDGGHTRYDANQIVGYETADEGGSDPLNEMQYSAKAHTFLVGATSIAAVGVFSIAEDGHVTTKQATEDALGLDMQFAGSAHLEFRGGTGYTQMGSYAADDQAAFGDHSQYAKTQTFYTGVLGNVTALVLAEDGDASFVGNVDAATFSVGAAPGVSGVINTANLAAGSFTFVNGILTVVT